MRVTIHQPEHLPWLGLLAKVAAADLWVVLDNVQYRRGYFQNRNRMLHDGRPIWLTVPVTGKRATLIRDIRVAHDPHWRQTYLGRLRHSLRHLSKDGPLEAVSAMFDAALAHESLLELNMDIVEWLLPEFGITTRRLLASDLGAAGTKSELLRNLCVAAGADEYLAGPFGRDYLDVDDFARHGIRVLFFDFEHPTYDQPGPFVPCLSSLDAWSRLAPGRLPGLLAKYHLRAT